FCKYTPYPDQLDFDEPDIEESFEKSKFWLQRDLNFQVTYFEA
ncbi:unnamed protein product, partial [Rotaria sp. Silwood2]